MPKDHEIAEMAAQTIVARHKLDRNENETGIEAMAWALGDEVEYESTLREFAVEIIALVGGENGEN